MEWIACLILIAVFVAFGIWAALWGNNPSPTRHSRGSGTDGSTFVETYMMSSVSTEGGHCHHSGHDSGGCSDHGNFSDGGSHGCSDGGSAGGDCGGGGDGGGGH